MSDASPHIGTLGEKSLHAALKIWYAQPGDLLEQRLGRYVIDIVRGDLLIEIQTRNFSAIKAKLTRLLEKHPVRLVHPIAEQRWVLRLDGDKETRLSRRKSPKRGTVHDIFNELTRIPDLTRHPNFSLEVLLTQEEVIRVNDGRGSWRRKGWSEHDRKLLDVTGRVCLTEMQDYRALIPADLPQPFTNKELAGSLGCPNRLAQRMTYCLRRMDILEVTGVRSRAYLYAEKPSLSD
jgi:hypothetical protein